MTRAFSLAVASVLLSGAASAQQMMPSTPPLVVVGRAPQVQNNLGGGFIEYLFGQRQAPPPHYGQPQPQQNYIAPPPSYYGEPAAQPLYASTGPTGDLLEPQARPDMRMDPQFLRQEVEYAGKEAAGTIVIDTPNHFLYLIGENGRALRYGIGVGRPGFTWSGVHTVSAKKEWPDWVPPKEMLERQPYLPHFMPGGPNNPLGARAMYLGSTLYRIHGSNEPWTIGQNVSSGCIRMRNADVIDLYGRVRVGARVVVL